MRWEPPANPEDLVVAEHDGVLELRAPGDRPGTGARVDLGAADARGIRSLPVVRSMGDRVRTVADATAGLLGDAWLLALAGFEVTAFERSPTVARLVRDGLRRAAADPRVDRAALARLRFEEADAAAALDAAGPGSFDAVLVDPMFPPKRKESALARKDVRLLRAAVGDDPDAAALLAAARRAARVRVAVKRADDSPPIEGAPEPDVRFEGRTSRVDVYLSRTTA
jgi:16S rRNA (guanine1516-N2)-methyltransferase